MSKLQELGHDQTTADIGKLIMSLSLGLAITSLLLTALLTGGWIKIAQAKQIQDPPERRRLHQTYVPRAGGISIALVMIFASTTIFFLSPALAAYWALIATAIILYSVLGFLDDLKPLRSSRKLFFHLLVAVILFLIARFPLAMNLAISIIIALAYLILVNIWNFMDGSNGMVSMQSLIIAIGFLALSDLTQASYYYALILAASCFAFLPFNFPTARVFLGDVGSHVLGAALVGLAVMAYNEAEWTILEILLLFSALWIDAVMTFIRRGLRGARVMQAHRSHLYQYAIRIGQSHTAVCLYYAAWTVFVIVLLSLCKQLPASSQGILLLIVIGLGCVLHQCLRLFVLKSRKAQAST